MIIKLGVFKLLFVQELTCEFQEETKTLGNFVFGILLFSLLLDHLIQELSFITKSIDSSILTFANLDHDITTSLGSLIIYM